jgi:integrase/recombinase XerD
MSKSNLIGHWTRRFLEQYLIGERNFSYNTQMSYRDTLILLLPYLAKDRKTSVDKLSIDDMASSCVRSFLLYLEEERHCSVSTRNQRLAAIHALARFIGESSPEHLMWSNQILSISFKKAQRSNVSYLEKNEMDALLDSPDRKTKQGMRDYALLLFLYNTGARASEAANVTIADLETVSSSSIKIIGKGNKVRHCPLWALTIKSLEPLILNRNFTDRIFLNCRLQPMTRYGVNALIQRHAFKASKKVSSFQKKKISPHSIRHTTAVHLLRSGVDINTIRAWLGHVSLETTNIYAEVDMEMKTKALAHCEIVKKASTKKKWHDKGTMAFLKAI